MALGRAHARTGQFAQLRALLGRQAVHKVVQLHQLLLGRFEIALLDKLVSRRQQYIRLFPPYLVAVGHGLLDLRQQPVHVLTGLYTPDQHVQQQSSGLFIALGLVRLLGLLVSLAQFGKGVLDF